MLKQCRAVPLAVVAAAAVILSGCTGSSKPSGDGNPDGSIVIPGGSDSGAGVPSAHGYDSRPLNTHCLAPERPTVSGGVITQRVFSQIQLDRPLVMLQPPGDASRFFVAEQPGTVRTFANTPNVSMTSVALDIRDQVNTDGEGGLLGMAFHPQYATNGYVFLSFTRRSGPSGMQSIIARYTRSGTGTTFDRGTERIILVLDQPETNHNGGGIAFDKKGLLYIGFGDGGGGGDQNNYAQNKNTLLGKFLRINIDTENTNPAYLIPSDNMYVASGGGRPEIFALGVRNPWRWSFDSATDELWAGDVGQGEVEEVDKIVLGGNYGWRIKEGSSCFNPNPCTSVSAGLIDPVAEYRHDEGISITGGFVYRGSTIPSLVGRFVYGDFSSGRLWAVATDTTTGRTSGELLQDTPLTIASFAQDADHELYVLDYGGSIHKLLPSGQSSTDTFPTHLSETGCFQPSDVKKVATGVIPYDVNMALWSDGAAKERYLAIPDGTQIRVGADGDWEFPNGAVLIKTFWLSGKRVETRLFMRHSDGVWAGYSYEWNDAQTDATLLPSSKTKTVGSTAWYFPSRTQCLQCHTAAAGRSLGPETAQMNRDITYPTGRLSNQIATLSHIGMFDVSPGIPALLPHMATLAGNASTEAKARAYLHANCSHCHRPNGTGRGPADFRAFTALSAMSVCNQDPTLGTLGIAGAKLLAPGKPAQSLLSVRAHRLDANRMPPLASSQVDTQGLSVVDAWISSLTGCP